MDWFRKLVPHMWGNGPTVPRGWRCSGLSLFCLILPHGYFPFYLSFMESWVSLQRSKRRTCCLHLVDPTNLFAFGPDKPHWIPSRCWKNLTDFLWRSKQIDCFLSEVAKADSFFRGDRQLEFVFHAGVEQSNLCFSGRQAKCCPFGCIKTMIFTGAQEVHNSGSKRCPILKSSE